MKGRQYVITPGRKTVATPLNTPPTLQAMKDVVGGYIERVPMLDTYWAPEDKMTLSCVAYCNEDGKRFNLPHNMRATLDWDAALRAIEGPDGPLYPRGLLRSDGRASDRLVGPVIVIVGDTEFMRLHVLGPEEEDERTPDDEWWTGSCDFIPMPGRVQ